MTEETIFLAALERTTPAERSAYLDAVCAGNSALRQRVAALLRSHADPDSFLDLPAVARQAKGTEEPLRTNDAPDSDSNEAAPSTQAVEPLPFLQPARHPGSLGRLDHYEILEVVGRGAMGVVFKARDTKLHRIVAIKVLAEHLAASGTARQRFFREARAAAAVRDEHVVGIHSVSDEDGPTPYLVMEFIGGVTLENRIKKKGALAVKEVLRIGMQAANGLSAAHRQGLIHRDVKPANILLENGVERVKITDFGLARAADDASMTQPGTIAGTPLYMSPEQARAEALDQRSDLFSLGSVLYTLCTGRQAFAAGNTMAVLRRVCEDTPRPIREINPDIPEWLAAIVSKLLAKEPGERFQTAGELAEVLGQHLAQVQQSHLTPAAAPEKPAPVPPAVAPGVPGGQAARRRMLVAVAGLLMVGVMAGVVAAAVVFWPKPIAQGDHSTRPSAQPSQPSIPPDPRVLTVSKRPEDKARFDTIQAALDEVEPGMTVRVLDDAVYVEYLLITARHRGVVLEAAGKATIRGRSNWDDAVKFVNVAGFTLHGFQFNSSGTKKHQIHIAGHCPGLVLDGLDMTSNENGDCIDLYSNAQGTKDAPIVVQNCTFRDGRNVFNLEGSVRNNWDQPLPCGYVVIRDNKMLRFEVGVVMRGAVHHVLVAGNRILNSRRSAIDLYDPLPGAADILLVNNTLFRNQQNGVRIFDDHDKGKDFLKCMNMRSQNNLILEHENFVDLVLLNHQRNESERTKPGDVKSLLQSPEWHFGYNWRELLPPAPGSVFQAQWIPPGLDDHREMPIEGVSRKPGANFLRPAKDSPLAWSGAGGDTLPAMRIAAAVGQFATRTNPGLAAAAVALPMSPPDRSLPAYVGAVPPEGVEPWDWEKTWKMLMH